MESEYLDNDKQSGIENEILTGDQKETVPTKMGKMMGIGFAAIWILNIVSMLGMMLMWQSREYQSLGEILSAIAYWLSYPAVIFAAIMASKLSKLLKSVGAKGGRLIMIGVILLFFSLFLSFYNCLGMNSVLGTNLEGSIAGVFIVLSILGVLLYTTSTILICIGTNKAYRIMPALKLSRFGIEALLVLAIILSPLTIGIVNSSRDMTIFNVIVLLFYLAAAALFVYPWFNVTELAPIEEESNNADNDKLLKKTKLLGIGFAAIWILNLISLFGITFTWTYPRFKLGTLVTSFAGLLSFPAVIFAIIMAFRWNKELKNDGKTEGNLIFIGVAMLLLSFLFSFSNCLGLNLSLGVKFSGGGVTGGVSTTFKILSVIAVLIYTASTFLIYKGTTKISELLPGLKAAGYGALALLALAVVLSPILIGVINSGGGIMIFNIFVWLLYAAAAALFVFPWFVPKNPEPLKKLQPMLTAAAAYLAKIGVYVWEFVKKYYKIILIVVAGIGIAVGAIIFFLNMSKHHNSDKDSDSTEKVASDDNIADQEAEKQAAAIAEFQNSIPTFEEIYKCGLDRREQLFKSKGFTAANREKELLYGDYVSTIPLLEATLILDKDHYCKFNEQYSLEEDGTGWTMEIVGAPEKLSGFYKDGKSKVDDLRRENPGDWYYEETYVRRTGNEVKFFQPFEGD